MNKIRLENLTDGVFAIVMTLLVIEIRVPEVHGNLAEALFELTPLFVSYFLSFAVLSTFWLAHHGIFHLFVRSINRTLIQLNILYLAFVALIPFSAHLLGSHLWDQTAVVWYGVNIVLAALVACCIFRYAYVSKEIEMADISARTFRQAVIRHTLNVAIPLLGVLASFVSLSAALVLYLVPVLINAIPGSLNLLEKVFGAHIPE